MSQCFPINLSREIINPGSLEEYSFLWNGSHSDKYCPICDSEQNQIPIKEVMFKQKIQFKSRVYVWMCDKCRKKISVSHVTGINKPIQIFQSSNVYFRELSKTLYSNVLDLYDCRLYKDIIRNIIKMLHNGENVHYSFICEENYFLLPNVIFKHFEFSISNYHIMISMENISF